MSDDSPKTEFWQVHIIGPDEYPTEWQNATLQDATANAHAFNATVALPLAVTAKPHSPSIWAVPERMTDE